MRRLVCRTTLLSLLACSHDAMPPPAVAPSPAPAAPAVTTPAPAVRDEPAAAPTLTPIDRQLYEQAISFENDGHLRGAKRILAKLLIGYPQQARLFDEFNSVEQRIEQQEQAAKSALEARPLQVLDVPPSVYTLNHPAATSAAPIPKLKIARQQKNAITDDERWFEVEDLHRPEYFVPPTSDFFFFRGLVRVGSAAAALSGFAYAEQTPSRRYLPDEYPTWLPVSYGTLPIVHAIDSAPMTVAIYGDRVAAVFDREKKLRSLFDLVAYQHPSRNVRGHSKVGEAHLTTTATTTHYDVDVETNSISHDLQWGLATEKTLFVAHGNLRYAKDNQGQNAYVSAIDLDTGALAWRSAPLVCNSRTFTLTPGGGAILAGYGFTAEPDFLYVLDAATGASKQKMPVPSGPEEIIAKEGRFYVRTYDTNLVLE